MSLYGRVNLGGGSSTKYPVGNVTDLSIKAGNGQLTIKWKDPADTMVSKWKGTKLVYKEGSYPTNENDGTTVLTNEERDKYAEDGYTIQNLTNGTTYYFKLFPYTIENAYTNDEENQISGTPRAYRIMTVKIDLTNSNPATCCSYDDDAIGMEAGSSTWDEFFGHYPVLFKEGQEVVKINPNNFAQDINGNSIDITSGDAGDVMIAFPRRGLKIETSTDENTVTVSMTDDLDNTDFEYMAHKRGDTLKDNFYLGAYIGYLTTSGLNSLSNKSTSNIYSGGPTNMRTAARKKGQSDGNGGSGYDVCAFYQIIYIQSMYLLKYRNLDSQTALGMGNVSSNLNPITTGTTDTNGMNYGTSSGTQAVKLFGLENIWGGENEVIEGIFNNNNKFYTATQNFNNMDGNNNGTGYIEESDSDITGIKLLRKYLNWNSTTTYFCDYSYWQLSKQMPFFGGYNNDGNMAGIFKIVSTTPNYSLNEYRYAGARLMYL